MSAISSYINAIRTAVYGEQVRGAIVSALEACYSDVTAPSLQTEAFSAALNEAYAGGILDIQTVTSFSAMTNQKIIYRYNGTAAGKQKGLYYFSALSDSWVLIGSEIQKVTLLSQMTDTNDIYKYIGTESGMVQNSLYCYNGTTWTPIGSGVLTAATAAAMTNEGAIYKYTGSEAGYTKNALYYYDGTAWTPVVSTTKLNQYISETENMFSFKNLNTRTINGVTVSFPNESTITVKTNGVNNQSAMIDTVDINCLLEAGKTYVYYRENIVNNGMAYDVDRANAETGIKIRTLSNGNVFTPAVDEKIRITFKSGNSQDGTVMFYFAEEDKASSVLVPHLSGVDLVARRGDSSASAPINYSDRVFLGKNVYLNGTTADIVNLRDSADYCCVIAPCTGGDKFRILAQGEASPRTWGFVDSTGKVLTVAASVTINTDHKQLDYVDISAPSGATHLVVNSRYKSLGATPTVWKLSASGATNAALEEQGIIPSNPVQAWKRKVVSTYGSFVVILDGAYLRLSKNYGTSFDYSVDVSAITAIKKAYHLFNNGALAFFTQKKAYYIDATWTGYAEAAVYEADGTTPYTPADLENFYTYQDYSSRKVVNGVDWYVFGNYIVNGGASTRKLIWCTMDRGQTYRIIYEFGENFAYNCRHVHFVQYYAADDVYIVGTGDGTNEDHVFALRYANNAWTMTVLGSGADYKWASLDIYGDEFYYTYDYTPGKLMMCEYADIGDFTKHIVVFDKVPNDAIAFKIGSRGDGVLTMSNWRTGNAIEGTPPNNVCSRSVFYTPDRKNFYQIFIPPQMAYGYTTFSGIMDVTDNGHLIVAAHRDNTTTWNKLPSLFLDDYIRNAGFPNALKPDYMLNGNLGIDEVKT